MTPIPGWYPDPADPETQRYWDGEQWLGTPLPVGAVPPVGPPPTEPVAATAPGAVNAPAGSADPTAPSAPGSRQAGWTPSWPSPPTGAPPKTDAPPQGDAKPSRWGQPGKPPPTLPPVPPGHIRVPGSTATMPLDVTKLAPLSLRVLARVIDIVAVFLLCLVVNGYFFYQFAEAIGPNVNDVLLGREAVSSEASRLNWIIIILTIGLWFAYEVPATANSGQTLGKRLVGIRVVKVVDDSSLTFGQSIRRWLILMLPSPAGSFLCGFPLQLADLLWCIWDRPARQCLHDKAVTSIVVRSSMVPVPVKVAKKSDSE
ncbi:RDD family protein [Cryptosporangium sp. NPDC051539]|uniref:RDD family protein n=1 Tax=Cryptosporangium sp. NPDC051539 TaxID=3363962 RepID=UPI00379B2A35